MFHAKFVGSLASLQFICFLAKGFLHLIGVEISWGLTLVPLWLLLGVAVVFWFLLGVVYAKFLR